MPYEFTPEERLQNILYTIKVLHTLMHESDSKFRELWERAIGTQLLHLNDATLDMRPKPTAEGG